MVESEVIETAGEGAVATGVVREVAYALDRARREARSSASDEVALAWGALVSGRLALVDRFERDGRRFLVARRVPEAGARPLSALERRVVERVCRGASNKLIAYELGLSCSTVAACLARALVRLGVASRVELIRLGAAAARRGAAAP